MAPTDDRARTRLILSAAALLACVAPARAQTSSAPADPPVADPRGPGYMRGPPEFGQGFFGPQCSMPVPALRRGQPALPGAVERPGEAPPDAEALAPVPPPALFFVPRGALEVTVTDNVGVTNTNQKSDLIF